MEVDCTMSGQIAFRTTPYWVLACDVRPLLTNICYQRLQLPAAASLIMRTVVQIRNDDRDGIPEGVLVSCSRKIGLSPGVLESFSPLGFSPFDTKDSSEQTQTCWSESVQQLLLSSRKPQSSLSVKRCYSCL